MKSSSLNPGDGKMMNAPVLPPAPVTLQILLDLIDAISGVTNSEDTGE